MMINKELSNKNYLRGSKMNSKRNGKLTKRATIKRMYLRALKSGKNYYSLAYIARRLNFDLNTARSFLNWMKTNTIVEFEYTATKHAVIFEF